MAKKKTALSGIAPHPTAEEIVKASLEPAQPEAEKEETIRFNFDIPKSLHKAFKLKALQDDKSMTDVVLQAIRDYVRSS